VRPPRFEPGSSAWQARMSRSIKWLEYRAEFCEYLKSKLFSVRYGRCLLSYLDKNIKELREPMDIVRIFSGLTQGQQHNMNRAVRALFNFLEIKGIGAEYLNAFRKAIPADVTGVDLRVPSELEISVSLRKLPSAPLKYRALYQLLLDSGLRLTEAVRVINNPDQKVDSVQDFYRATLGYFRGSKLAYAAYFSATTLNAIQENHEKIDERAASHYFAKYGYVAPKYLRKFAFDKMIELVVPESVADFIEGRTPKKTGAKHYMALVRQADKFYDMYAEYLHKLRKAESQEKD